MGGLIAVALISIAAMVVALYGINSNRQDPRAIASNPATDFQLITCAKGLSGNNSSDVTLISDYEDVCYRAAYNQALITDFEIRRIIYSDQPYLDRVLLWTVVSITISGVILSAVQLMTSYKLAVLGKLDPNTPSDLKIQKDQITLRSSVVGLFILLISLVFFVIFVYGVYTIKPNKSDSIESLHGASGSNSAGGLGHPPIQKVPASALTTTSPQ
jgi:hypothetical protein